MKLHSLSLALLCATISSAVCTMDNDPNRAGVDAGAPALPHILNALDSDGLAPLHKIVSSHNYTDEQRIKFIEKFVRHGANINLGMPAKPQAGSYGFTPLHVAIYNKRSATVIEALLKYGASMQAVDFRNRTPLSLAVDCGCEDQLETLLSHIPDVVVAQPAQGLPNPAAQQ